MLPTRDRRYFFAAAMGAAGLGVGGVCSPLVAAPAAAMLVANSWFGWLSVFPYDRILSAVSDDGLRWKQEPGVRVDVAGYAGEHAGGTYFPCVIALKDATWRMYFRGSDVDRILSARSEDGLVWRIEPGVRVDVGGMPELRRVSCPRVVLQQGVLRMFFTGREAMSRGFSVYSAVSNDGRSWEREAGVRLAPDGATPYKNIYSFCLASQTHDRELRMYYEGVGDSGSQIYLAVSSDGLTWKTAGPVLAPRVGEFGVGSPWIVPTSPEGWRLYFTGGTTHRALGTSIYSAVSSDGLEWTREDGVRLEHRGRHAGHGLISPCVIDLPSGHRRMYFGGYWGWHVLAPLTRRRHRMG